MEEFLPLYILETKLYLHGLLNAHSWLVVLCPQLAGGIVSFVHSAFYSLKTACPYSFPLWAWSPLSCPLPLPFSPPAFPIHCCFSAFEVLALGFVFSLPGSLHSWPLSFVYRQDTNSAHLLPCSSGWAQVWGFFFPVLLNCFHCQLAIQTQPGYLQGQPKVTC